jgi:hypothetical protein
MIRASCAALSMSLTVLCATPADAQRATLPEVLARAGAYIADFQRQLSGIVAEERYVQIERNPVGLLLPSRRELRSDLLLVKPAASRDWLQFRDIFEIDGLPVRDRAERLTMLFLDPSTSSREQIRRILDESARFNIGAIKRNINLPVLALFYLDPANQTRFRFKRTSRERPTTTPNDVASSDHFRISTEVWAIEYEERSRPTFIHTEHGRDLPSKGRFWIEPATGRVLMTELQVQDRAVRATIDVSYQSEPLVGLLVPIAMRERYDSRGRRVDGMADYGRFRQFQVNVNQSFAVLKK